MNNGPGLKRQMGRNANVYYLGISNVHLSHGLTRTVGGTTNPLLLMHSVVTIVWVTDAEAIHYVLKCTCLHSVLGFGFSWK